jgi:CheY-like chemotaxis protein
MMPEMNGPATMQRLREEGYTKPIVILTANALAGQETEYINSGFDAFLSKPIITEKLDSVLVKFVKEAYPPEEVQNAVKNYKSKQHTAEEINDYRNNMYILGKLRSDFLQTQKHAFTNIVDALSQNDTEKAHILSHTLNGLSAVINEPALSNAAATIEKALSQNATPTKENLTTLGTELTKVIESISKSEPKKHHILNRHKILAILNNLEPLLEQRRTDSIEHIKQLTKYPQAAILIKQIEDFKFKDALESLHILKGLVQD